MKVLIIGGPKFLGYHIIKDLLKRGHRITVLNRGNHEPLEGVECNIKCDIHDRKKLKTILQKEKWDAVIDTILQKDDLEFIIPLLNGRIGHFIHTGSFGVYTQPGIRSIPSVESEPILEHNATYSFKYKVEQEQVLQKAFYESAFPATTLRMSYIYGPNNIPLDCWGGRQIEFFEMVQNGKTIPIPHHGLPLLHPGHVNDLARAFGNALEHPASIGQNYNIGGTSALTILDYLKIIAEILNVKLKYEFWTSEAILNEYPDYTNERGLLFLCEHMCGNISKAKSELDWYPKIPLKVGLKESVEDLKKQNRIKF